MVVLPPCSLEIYSSTQAGDPFHVVQRSVICNNLHDLLNRLAGKVGDMQASLEPS